MEEAAIKLRATVRHKATGVEGRVTSIHQTLMGTQFCVEYKAGDGGVREHWTPANELEAIDTASG